MLASLLVLAGCAQVQGLIAGLGKGGAADAEAKLKNGDLAAAATAYDAALKTSPTDVDIATGAAYAHLLQGDAATAEAILAAAAPTAGEKASDVAMRRALVAIQAGDLDKVREQATAAGTPAGKLLAGEVALANDGDRAAAKALFDQVKAEPGAIGTTAGAYLALLADQDQMVTGLAEVQALWALGQRPIAVRSVEDPLKAYAESHEDGAEQLLMWAGRAAVVGETGVATDLLDAITVPPAGQAWRVQATRAILAAASGDGAACVSGLDAIKATAPADGYVDARATAALVLAAKDPGTAKTLVDGLSGDAAARALAALGDKAAAAKAAKDPILKAQLGAAGG